MTSILLGVYRHNMARSFVARAYYKARAMKILSEDDPLERATILRSVLRSVLSSVQGEEAQAYYSLKWVADETIWLPIENTYGYVFQLVAVDKVQTIAWPCLVDIRKDIFDCVTDVVSEERLPFFLLEV